MSSTQKWNGDCLLTKLERRELNLPPPESFQLKERSMARIAPVNRREADPRSNEMLDAVQKKLGMTPNLMSTLAHSPAALEAYLKLSEATGKGVLPAKTREQIALAVGQANSCNYCVSAHSAIGKMIGLTAEEIREARTGRAADTKSDAILRLTTQVVEKRGFVSDADLTAARSAGVTDAEVTEIVANTALNLLTNYFNHVAETEIDFPLAEELQPEAACETGCSV